MSPRLHSHVAIGGIAVARGWTKRFANDLVELYYRRVRVH